MKWIDYREKLGISFSDDQKFEALKNKLINIVNFINEGPSFVYTPADLVLFMTSIGERLNDYYGEELDEARQVFEKTHSLTDLLSKYVEFCNCYNHIHKSNQNKELFDFLEKFLYDLNIPYEILEDGGGKYFFPKGVEDFDKALVSEVLSWLEKYPKSEKAWSKALREYSGAREQNASDVADLFRKALESFFQEFFCNDKVLENNKSEYGKYLKSQGVPAEISNNLETLLLAFTNFMNGYAKHHDKTETKVLEYLMYQTGNIIRLLISLSEKAE